MHSTEFEMALTISVPVSVSILETAARLIKGDIKTNAPSINGQYPTTEPIKLPPALDYIPESRRIVLKALFVGSDTRNIASTGHAIIQAV